MRGREFALTVAVVVIVSMTASGQTVLFGRSSEYLIDGRIRDVAIADFTGDGLADLYVARSSSDFGPKENIILENLGGGRFVVPEDEAEYYYRQLASEAQPTWGVTAADFDNDGLVDVALGNQAGVANEIWLRTEAGFLLHSSFGAGSNTSSILAIHLDEDSFLDLVVGNNNGSTSAIYLNDQSGGFSEDARTLLVGNNMTDAVEIGDLNQDSLPDLVVCNGDPQFSSVHLSDGAGGFLHSFTLSRFDQNTRGATIGDFNADGFADIVLANGKKGVEFWAGDGSGLNFKLAQRLEDASRPQMPVAFQQRASDVALLGGQYPNAFVAHSDSSAHTINEIMLNQPWRHFDDGQRFGFGFFMGGGETRRVLLHDFSGDGVSEVVVVNVSSVVVWSTDRSSAFNR